MFNYFRQNTQFATDCQLLRITHEIQKNFDCSPTRDIKTTSLNILNAFVKIWHLVLIFKLQSCEIEGNVLSLFKNYLKAHQQRDVLNK